jgi:hypothetical protein
MNFEEITSLAVLVFFLTAWSIILRKRLDWNSIPNGIIGSLLVFSLVFVLTTKQYLYSLPLLLGSYLVVLLFPAIFVTAPVLGDFFRFCGSTYLHLIQIGISEDKIMKGRIKGSKELENKV